MSILNLLEALNNFFVLGDFHVYSKSSSYDGLDTCEIKVNGGGNICKKGRGHNVVVVDPITLEYDSVSFDTYGDHTAVCEKLFNSNNFSVNLYLKCLDIELNNF